MTIYDLEPQSGSSGHEEDMGHLLLPFIKSGIVIWLKVLAGLDISSI